MDAKYLERHTYLYMLLLDNNKNELYLEFKNYIHKTVYSAVIRYNLKKEDAEDLFAFANLTFLQLLKRYKLEFDYPLQKYLMDALSNHVWKESLKMLNYNNNTDFLGGEIDG